MPRESDTTGGQAEIGSSLQQVPEAVERPVLTDPLTEFVPTGDKPTEFKRLEGLIADSDADRLRDQCQDLSRQACDRFRDACEARTADEAEVSFLAAKDLIQDLWRFRHIRGRGFQDLLGLLDAALRRADLGSFDDRQRNALRTAFMDLRRWIIEDDVVAANIDHFADADIDILGPMRSEQIPRMRITIEELK